MTRTPGRGSDDGASGALILVPAATFLVGLLLGAALVWVTQPGEDEAAEAPQPSPTVSATPSPGNAGPVSDACVRAARAAGTLVTLVRDAAEAIGDLDVPRLQRLVDRMEVLDRGVRDDVLRCEREASRAGGG